MQASSEEDLDPIELEPIFVSVKKAAQMLDLVPWSVYKLCNEGKLEAVYQGRRRSIFLSSVREYAKSLPETPERPVLS